MTYLQEFSVIERGSHLFRVQDFELPGEGVVARHPQRQARLLCAALAAHVQERGLKAPWPGLKQVPGLAELGEGEVGIGLCSTYETFHFLY